MAFIRRRHGDRRRGAVDTTDLLIGLLLGLGLPLLSWGIMGAVFPAKPAATSAQGAPAPAPDAEEVRLRLDYVKKLYDENASYYLKRAIRTEDNTDQIVWMRWAHRALQQVKVEASGLEHLINSTDSGGEFASALASIKAFVERSNEGLRKLKELDTLGTLKIQIEPPAGS